jgi:nicotinate dehydrogenase subunit B
MATMSERPAVVGPTLSRRQFIKAGGILVVGFSFAGPELLKGDTAKPAVLKNSLDPTLSTSWIEIHPDNTLLIRTGKSDFGQGTTFTAYRQIVAEELSVPFEAITTVVQGHTDQHAGWQRRLRFSRPRGTPNIRKAAAYTYQALLNLASRNSACRKSALSVKDGIVSGGGKSISYGDLVKNQQLKLTIPVSGDLTSIMGLTIEGDPPMKPVSEYTSSASRSRIPSSVRKWLRRRPGPPMCGFPACCTRGWCIRKRWARTLVSAGAIDKTKFPNAQVIVKGNLVGVVAPTEWEAIQAAEQVAGARNGLTGKACPAMQNSTNTCAKKRIGPPRQSRRAMPIRAMPAPCWRRRTRNFPRRINFHT